MTNGLEATRREFFKLGGGALTLGGLGCLQAQARDEATGSVAGRVLDKDTRCGLAGVRVSNGCDVAISDAAGFYRLPARDGAMVFVVKPAGWSVPIDARTMLPRFHHRVQAAGSYDFALSRAIEPERFEVLMFADPQPADVAELGYIREQVVGALAGSEAAFGLMLGDVTGDNPSLYEPYNQAVAQIGLPWWNLPGNHDLDYDAPHPALARETWKRTFGPPAYAFEHGSALFIMLDNVEWRGAVGGGHSYRGRIGADQLAFVRALLASTPADRLVVLCMHIPLISAVDPDDPSSNTLDRDALLALVGERPCVSFSGHMHTTEHHYLPLPGGGQHHHHVLTAVSGSWWSGPLDARGVPLAQSCDGTPNGWHVLTIDGASYATRFVSAREPAQMRIMLEDPGAAPDSESCLFMERPAPRERADRMRIVVNVFDAGPHTRVECCVSGCEASLMRRHAQTDPVTRELFVRAGHTRKPWVEALASSHIWVAPLPQSLPVGSHRLMVTATNEYGQTHSDTLVFNVA